MLCLLPGPLAYSFLPFWFILLIFLRNLSKQRLPKIPGTVKRLWLVIRWNGFRPDLTQTVDWALKIQLPIYCFLFFFTPHLLMVRMAKAGSSQPHFHFQHHFLQRGKDCCETETEWGLERCCRINKQWDLIALEQLTSAHDIERRPTTTGNGG